MGNAVADLQGLATFVLNNSRLVHVSAAIKIFQQDGCAGLITAFSLAIYQDFEAMIGLQAGTDSNSDRDIPGVVPLG